MTLAHFQMFGSCFSARDEFIILQRGIARLSEKSFRSQFGMLSGPHALDEEIWLSNSDTLSQDIWGSSKLVTSNLLVCDKGPCCG